MTNKTQIADLQSMPQAEFDKLGFVTDNNSGGYYLAECDNCGAIFPSQQSDGGQQIADTGDYDDCLCQHCGHIDPEECDNANLVWNVQQLKIINITTQLEAAEARIAEQTSKIGRLALESNKIFDERKTLQAQLAAIRGAAVPVAYTDLAELNFVNDMACMWTKGVGVNEIPLFTHPAPVVVLPDVTTVRANWSVWQWIEHLGGRYQHGNVTDYVEFGSVYAVGCMLNQFKRTVTATVLDEVKARLAAQGITVKSSDGKGE